MRNNCLFACLKKSQPGAILPLTAVVIITLIGFLGIVAYLGMSSYLQDELQNATLSSALVGASALHDSGTKNNADGIAAAQAVFQRILANSTTLQEQQATFTATATPTGIQVQGQATAPTPFFAALGITTLRVQSAATAQPVLQRYGVGSLTARFRGISACGTTPTKGQAITVQLSEPLTDHPGTDLFIESRSGRGYRVEACSGGACRDIGGAAQFANSNDGMLRYQGSVPIVYGSASIDLGSTGAQYAASVKKATSLRFTDDGVYDVYQGGSRSIELCPEPVSINSVSIYHHAVACANQSCPLPPNFQWR